MVKYLGTCSPALRRYFHCHGRKHRASRYRRLLVFPEETEERKREQRKGGIKDDWETQRITRKIICKWEWRLNLLVWLRTLVRWLVTPAIILPKDGRLCEFCCDELAKKRGSDTIKGFKELGKPAGTAFVLYHLYCCPQPHTPNHRLCTKCVVTVKSNG